LQRYEQQDIECLPKELSDRMLQVAKVYARAVEVFEDEQRALEWLQAPIVALGGRIPVSLLDTSTGVDLVLTELGRIEYGVFA
jgi:putative toxin-antitoxin system antitoxin component (TIGR02293 family)